MKSLRDTLKNSDIFIDNEYFNRYIELIELNMDRKYEKFKVQCHHIVPRCYFVSKGIQINEDKENKVYLLHRDHVLAHYYLCLCAKEKSFRYKNQVAIRHILGNLNFKASETYLEDIEFIESLDKYDEIKRGYRHSEETKRKIKESNRNRVHDDIWVTDGIRDLRIKEHELEYYLKDGYRRGITNSHPNPLKGRNMPEEWKKKLSEGQRRRFETSCGTMLGKHLTEEQRKKCSEAHKGTHMSLESKTKLSNRLKGSRIMNKDGINKRVLADEVDHFLNAGWLPGRFKTR